MTLLTIIKELHAEACRSVEAREMPYAREPREVSDLFQSIRHNGFKIRLLNAAPPESLAQALYHMPSTMIAEALVLMRQTQRDEVLENMTAKEEARMLKRVSLWQELCAIDDEYPATMILTEGAFPRGFPESMEECYVCHREYELWSSVNIVSCHQHSYCDFCRTKKYCGACRGLKESVRKLRVKAQR